MNCNFRKKPVVIEAFRAALYSEMPSWLLKALDETKTVTMASDGFDIQTLEGVMHANFGDWIIQGVKGEIYPCKPDIFAATYEYVDNG